MSLWCPFESSKGVNDKHNLVIETDNDIAKTNLKSFFHIYKASQQLDSFDLSTAFQIVLALEEYYNGAVNSSLLLFGSLYFFLLFKK